MKETFILKRAIIITVLIAVTIALLFVVRRISVNNTASDFAKVEEGSFKISVSASGELLAEKSIDLKGPIITSASDRRGRGRRRRIRAMNLKILDIVPEGTIVKEGDYVAQLDRTNYDNILKDELERLNSMQENLKMEMLDTGMVLKSLRNDIRNQVFAAELATITYEQSKYEPPATIRRAKIDMNKENRSLRQKRRIYNLRLKEEIMKINNIRLNISSQARLVDNLNNYLSGFIIKSPAKGMVIYKRNWNGTKRKEGSTINPFDMVVATLPDLSSMISKTYISEIDIGKLKTGQKVNIKVDAFPHKEFTGNVLSIAKIGEQLPNSDTKMFEVEIRLNGFDPALRPSMTTSNEIIIKSFDDVVYVPLECVNTDADGLTYVYTKNEAKQIVELGESNNKYIIVNKGLDPGTEIYLTIPEDSRKFRLAGENVVSEIDQSSGN